MVSGLPPSAAVQLRQLFPFAESLPQGEIDLGQLPLTSATEDSRQVEPGSLFAVIPGTRKHGAEFVAEAERRGAVGLLVERPLASALPQFLVPNVRAAFARICSALAGSPSRKVRVAGVTGTNGKTTVTWMTRALLQSAGHQTGVLGTIEYHDGVHSEPASLTTPDSRTLAQWLGRMATQQTSHAAIELSSHALHQGRAIGTELTCAVVTNITQDHFDYHGTFEHYVDSKAEILRLLKPSGCAVLNRDDEASWSLRHRLPASQPRQSISTSGQGDVSAQIMAISQTGLEFRLQIHGASERVFLPALGRHNVANALAAAAIATHWGLSPSQIAAGLQRFAGVPGRLQRIDCGQPFAVFVDFAHTDDALRRCLLALKAVTVGQLWCVFGAGGDRDRSKRPKLGQAAMIADHCVLTSDNPRSEDPIAILREIQAGMENGSAATTEPTIVVEPDREQAIGWALRHAQPGDCVLLAGKGHECTQHIGTRMIPFRDADIARRWMQSAGWALARQPYGSIEPESWARTA
jgi:UDP-N-acetylmuramoyl-L-alanyl-D-glutamate--2,6-diaminopimelate ligase